MHIDRIELTAFEVGDFVETFGDRTITVQREGLILLVVVEPQRVKCNRRVCTFDGGVLVLCVSGDDEVLTVGRCNLNHLSRDRTIDDELFRRNVGPQFVSRSGSGKLEETGRTGSKKPRGVRVGIAQLIGYARRNRRTVDVVFNIDFRRTFTCHDSKNLGLNP